MTQYVAMRVDMRVDMRVNSVQVVLVGGIFPQFRLDSNKKFVVDESGVRRMAAVQMAINSINDKTDGYLDELLPNTQVRCEYIVVLVR